jgi:hypothetical protein
MTLDTERSPPSKRPRLDDYDGAYDVPSPPVDVCGDDKGGAGAEVLDDDEADRCSICLNDFRDPAVLPECSHSFCFECIVIWTGTYGSLAREALLTPLRTEQSRKCPLCTRVVGPHIVHRIRGPRDFQRYFLPPLRTSPPATGVSQGLTSTATGRHFRARPAREWGRRERDRERLDALERAVEKRQWVYANRLYAKACPSSLRATEPLADGKRSMLRQTRTHATSRFLRLRNFLRRKTSRSERWRGSDASYVSSLG